MGVSFPRQWRFLFDFIKKCYLCLCIWFFPFLFLHNFGLFLVFHRSTLHAYVFLNLSLALTKWPSSSAASSHPDIWSSLWPMILMKLFIEVFIWFIQFFIVSISSVCLFFNISYFCAEFYFHTLIWFSYCIQLCVFLELIQEAIPIFFALFTRVLSGILEHIYNCSFEFFA